MKQSAGDFSRTPDSNSNSPPHHLPPVLLDADDASTHMMHDRRTMIIRKRSTGKRWATAVDSPTAPETDPSPQPAR